MGLNCEGCEHKTVAANKKGHCTQFQLMPQIDECKMHTMHAKAPDHKRKPNIYERPLYIGLRHDRSPDLPAVHTAL